MGVLLSYAEEGSYFIFKIIRTAKLFVNGEVVGMLGWARFSFITKVRDILNEENLHYATFYERRKKFMVNVIIYILDAISFQEPPFLMSLIHLTCFLLW